MVTAYCYDPLYLEHNLPGHPENQARLVRIMKELQKTGLLEGLLAVAARPATEEVLTRVHLPGYIATVQAMAQRGGGHLDMDTYLGGASYDAAVLAAGGTVAVVDAVLNARARNGIALVRPPGHHAEAGRGMGFCLFNNVAVAAQAALDHHGLRRILILDWDVHHGNGTQSIFYSRPEVLYFSTHQFPHYPGTGSRQETGSGAGRGYTVNVPLPAGVGDEGFRRIFAELLWPVAERFHPELILVSAGYDAHWADPLAGLYLSLAGYWQMARSVVEVAESLCGGRLVVVLEGGYDLDVLGHGVADTCRALLGEAAPGPDPLGPCRYLERSIDAELQAVKALHGLT